MAELLDTVKAEIDKHEELVTAALREKDELREQIATAQAALDECDTSIEANQEALEKLRDIRDLAAELPTTNGDQPTRKKTSTGRAAPAGPPRQPTRRAPDPPSPRRPAGEAPRATPAARAASPARRPAKPGDKTPKGVTAERVLEFIRRRGSVVRSDVDREFSISPTASSHHVGNLIRAKSVVEAGTRGNAKIYRPADQVPQPRPGNRGETAHQEPALEGRILSLLCHKYLTPAQVATELDAAPSDVDALIAKMLADGEVERLPDGRYRGNE